VIKDKLQFIEEIKMKKIFNSNHLKLIAIIAMTIDHLTWLAFPGCQKIWYVMLLHIIGRLTAPIMWFFIVEGYNHTHNLKRYLIRLFSFAIISHFAYCLAFGISFIPNSAFNGTSVMWSLAWAVVLLAILDSKKINEKLKILLMIAIFLITFPSDWSCIAVFAIIFMNKYRGNFKRQMLMMMIATLMYATVYFIFLDKVYGIIQLFTCLTIPVLYLYNGERGKMKLKYLFYIYYPLHLVIIGIIRLTIYGNIPLIVN
jgi:hypothetical protein